MYKVVLADDESVAMDGLLHLTDWDELGFTVCAACDNGEDALQAVTAYSPDVVVTDIRMPVIDGLELIRLVRKMDIHQPVFMVLSGYGEFEYARTALRYGVRHYLLKPVIDEEWDSALRTIAGELEARTKAKIQQQMLGSRLLPVTIARMLEGKLAEPEGDIAALMDQLDETASGWTYIHIDNIACSVRKNISELCQKWGDRSSTLYIDLPGDQAGIVMESSPAIPELAGRLFTETLQNGKKGTVSIGPGVQSLREVPVSYLMAAEAAGRQQFYSEPGGPIDSTREIRREPGCRLLPSENWTEELLVSVERLQEEKMAERLTERFEWFKQNRTEPEIVRTAVIDIMLKAMELLGEYGGSAKLWGEVIQWFKAGPKSLSALEEFIRRLLSQSIKQIRQHKERGSEHPLVRIEYFLKDNYKQTLTVKEIAEQLYIHPVYLGQAFIKKHGISILEYLHNLRIEEAKKRLAESGETVRSIAESVGYAHYHHFLREFEKRVSLKPVDYRKQAKVKS